MKKIFTVLSLSLLLTTAYCQSVNTAKLDSLFQALQENNKFMGTIAIAADSKVIYSNAIGKADIVSGQVLKTDTKFRIGSISKMFTSALIIKAIEEKKLTLDQTISQYIPGIEKAKMITLDNLLNHRSGIHNFTDDAAYLSYNTQPKTEKELLEIIQKGKSDFEPGSKSV